MSSSRAQLLAQSSAPCHSRAFDEILARFSDRASLAPSLPESQSNLTSDSPTHIITSPNPKLRKLEARRLTTTRPVSRRFCPFPGSTCVRRTVRSTGTYNTYVLRTSVYSRQTSVRPWCTHAELAKSSSKHMESRRRQRHNERLAATHVHSHMYSTVLCALTPISCAPGTIQFADAFARPCNHSHREVDMQSTQSWWWGTRTYSSRTRSRCTIWPAGARRRIRRDRARASNRQVEKC